MKRIKRRTIFGHTTWRPIGEAVQVTEYGLDYIIELPERVWSAEVWGDSMYRLAFEQVAREKDGSQIILPPG